VTLKLLKADRLEGTQTVAGGYASAIQLERQR
jgi:hypothetical protein